MLKSCTYPVLYVFLLLLISCNPRTGKTEAGQSVTKPSVATARDSLSSGQAEKAGEQQTVTDFDGNEYPVITIGSQTWMMKNLKTTRFNDGTPIPLVTDGAAWTLLTTPGYCWYDNDESSYKPMYGALYNGFAALTGKLCPAGWHVPADVEWAALVRFLGGEQIAGARLKEQGTNYWVNPNLGATNASGFSALPGGVRYHDGAFHDFGFSGYFWTSTEYYNSRAIFYYVDYQYTDVFRFDNLKKIGFSIRCIRDY